jgi:SAM-dependent methyltransferase
MSNSFIKRDHCLICGDKNLTKYLSLGKSAFANSLLEAKDLDKPEPKAPLDVYFCNNCKLVQLLDIVDRQLLFNKYYYFSSTSPVLVNHFESYAEELVDLFPAQAKKLVIDIGSNDGILLKPLQQLGCTVLGIDPAKNIAKDLEDSSIDTIWDFFGTPLVPSIMKKYGKAGIISANNVLAHTDAIHDILDGVRELLDDDGVFVFEVQYILDLLEKNEFDNTYHEHICHYALAPILYLLKKHNMSAFKVKHVDTHGGSLRVYASLSSRKVPVDSSIKKLLKREHEFGLDTAETYVNFAKNAPINKRKLRTLLLSLKKKNKTIVGYGAPAKAATLLQYCNIGTDIIDYITDSAPSKQGLYLPGVHIPILSPQTLKTRTPDYIVILAWNYAPAIMEKESWFSDGGGKFIIPVPSPRVVK